MKRKLLIISIFICCLIFTGCAKSNQKDIVSKLEKNLSSSKGYSLTGILEIINNEDTYTYDVNVAYKEGDNFRVSLKNQVNNHEQIILRNVDGVYVKTQKSTKQKLNVI